MNFQIGDMDGKSQALVPPTPIKTQLSLLRFKWPEHHATFQPTDRNLKPYMNPQHCNLERNGK